MKLSVLLFSVASLATASGENQTAYTGNFSHSENGNVSESSHSEASNEHPTPLNILLGNDDGFDTDLIQDLFVALEVAGHNVVMSAPFEGQSGTAGTVELFQPILPTSTGKATVPTDSPGVGPTGIKDKQFYVNGAGTAAVWYGLDVLSPRFFNGKAPDLVIMGPNEGNNVGLITPHSGTVGGAISAMNRGIPSVAISAAQEEQNPGLVAQIMVRFVDSLIVGTTGEGTTELAIPPYYGLNVNLPATTDGSVVDDYSFVKSKIGRAAFLAPKFFDVLGTSPAVQSNDELAALRSLPFPGLGISVPYSGEGSGYQMDSSETSEYNVISADSMAISVSVIQSTYQAPKEVEKEIFDSLGPVMQATNQAPKEVEEEIYDDLEGIFPSSNAYHATTCSLAFVATFVLSSIM